MFRRGARAIRSCCRGPRSRSARLRLASNQWRSTLADTDRLTFVYVAGQDGAISGFGSAGAIRWTGFSTGSEVSALYLLNAVKRRGIGRMLFARLLGELAARGFTSTGLWVLTQNEPARRFYEAMGGRAGATRIESHGEYVLDEIAYVWDDLGAFRVSVAIANHGVADGQRRTESPPHAAFPLHHAVGRPRADPLLRQRIQAVLRDARRHRGAAAAERRRSRRNSSRSSSTRRRSRWR